MQYIKNKNIPLILQLVKSDLTYEQDAIVTYNIYDSDMTTLELSGNVSFNSTVNAYTNTLNISS